MAHHRSPLWLTLTDVDPNKMNVPLSRLRERGPYADWKTLLETHIDLLSEDFLCAVSEQVNKLRADPTLLDTNMDCYVVTGSSVRYRKTRGRFAQQEGVEFTFDADKYRDVEWDEEKRLMRNNLVLLTQDGLQTFAVGLIHASGQRLLEKGTVVVQMASGLDAVNYFPHLLPQDEFVGKTYHLVESAAFHFPYLQVTRVLRKGINHVLFRPEEVARQFEYGALLPEGLVTVSYAFEDEILLCRLPSRRPEYLEPHQDVVNALLESIRNDLNASQALAVEKVLQYRVALVQGPPGTGKTYLGSKVAQLFVLLKSLCPGLLPGPILVVTQSNHAVQEFLQRCNAFSDKVIHCCSDKHDRSGKQQQAVYARGELQKEHDRAPHRDKPGVMLRADIVGMTTTRGACLRQHLDQLGIRVVIVEEAAEVLEAHVLACIPVGAQHLIQIGDHRQLRPSCAHEALGREYRLDLSLFERLVNNGADCPMLSEQRRMRPAIADLVRSVYPNLTDHESTHRRGRLDGVDLEEPVFFMNHVYTETKEGKGYVNRKEAEVAVELACYLVRREYNVATITILTTYRRQLRLLTQLIGAHPLKEMRQLRATTVDSFQGEENNIIILSLVRSNPSGEIGFLKMANRATVALSRARNGFFLLGNLACLTSTAVPVWAHVESELAKGGRVGHALPLHCPVHRVAFRAASADDIRAAMGRCCLCARHQAVMQQQQQLQLLEEGVSNVTLDEQ